MPPRTRQRVSGRKYESNERFRERQGGGETLRFKTCLPAFEEETSQAPPVLSALRLIRGESLLQDQIQAAPVPKMSSNHFRPGLWLTFPQRQWRWTLLAQILPHQQTAVHQYQRLLHCSSVARRTPRLGARSPPLCHLQSPTWKHMGLWLHSYADIKVYVKLCTQIHTQLLVQHQGGTTSAALEVRRSFKWSDLCHVLHPVSETLAPSPQSH